MERPVTFLNRSGLTLFGMLYSPDVGHYTTKVGIVISVNDIKYRIGTFRYHVLLARRLASRGYYVLCFDPAGIGDSEGDFEEKLLTEHQRDILSGKYLSDTQSAIDFLEKEIQFDRLLLLGLCGGAMTSLITAASDNRISGTVLLGLPIDFPPNENIAKEVDEVRSIYAKEQAATKLISMSRKTLNVNYWKKCFSGDIEWRKAFMVMYKSLSVILKSIAQGIIGKSYSYDLQKGPSISSSPYYNRLFQESFAAFVKKNKGQLLFIFGGEDPVSWRFKSSFQDKILVPGNKFEKLVDVFFIANANHIFSGEQSQQELTSIIENWMLFKYPASM